MIENTDQQVLAQLTRWITAGKKSWLATVIRTWGSSPRPAGSIMSCNEDGHVSGSLSGGCIEEDLLEKMINGGLAQTKPEIMLYGKTADESERFGLPCGGQLEIIVEPLINNHSLPAFKTIISRLNERQCIERKVDIATGEITIKERNNFKHLQFIGDFANTSIANKNFFVQTYGPRCQLLLIGAGQVSHYLAQMAQMMDYHVMVCDPREEMIEQWGVEGTQLVNEMPDDAIRNHASDYFTAIIALTHDPRIDDMGLMEALKTDSFFIGAMGSVRTSEKRRDRLLQLNLNERQISKLHAPVGLPIGSKTPAEIAVAILAQLTEMRSKNAQTVKEDSLLSEAATP